jgi:hypothetical protein
MATRGADGPRCWLITPTPALFHQTDRAAFESGYIERLDRFGVAKIGRTLERIARDHQADRLVLLCHEPNWNLCHRQSAADWMLATAGEVVIAIDGTPRNQAGRTGATDARYPALTDRRSRLCKTLLTQ